MYVVVCSCNIHVLFHHAMINPQSCRPSLLRSEETDDSMLQLERNLRTDIEVCLRVRVRVRVWLYDGVLIRKVVCVDGSRLLPM
jgi:hypothetical protein